MIGYVNGIIEYIEEGSVVIDVGGIGLNVFVSTDTVSKLPTVGEKIKLYTYTCVREDAFLLYGFLSRNDLDIFKKCITVNGIGPKGALSLLSAMDANTLRYAILNEDKKLISKAPGIGGKTAERLILELKNKLDYTDELIAMEVNKPAGICSDNGNSDSIKEAVEALVALGYSQSESVKAVNSIEDVSNMDSGTLLKKALKLIM